MIAVFLFTRWFWRYVILHVNSSVFRMTFFCTSPWWLHDCGLNLWFVFCSKLRICFCLYVGIIPTAILRACLPIQYLLSRKDKILLACAACFTVFLPSTSEIRETTISTSAQHLNLIFRHEDSVHNPQTQTLIPLESWRSQLSPGVIRLGGHTDYFVRQSWSYVLRLIFLTESSKRSKRRYELSKNARKMTFFVIPRNKIITKRCAQQNGQVYSNGLLIYVSSFNQTCSKRCIFVLSAGLATSRI